MGRGIRAAAWVLASVLSANAETHTVQVGGGGLDKFSPDTLTARDGDVVIYSFHSGNHSVIQTSLESPCRPLDGGFSSGFVPTEGTSPVTWRVIVNGTAPVHVYSGQGDGCRKGMLQIINPPSDDALHRFNKAAGNATTRAPGNEPMGGQRVLRIDVGKDEHVFSPREVRDQPAGTTVRFHFHPKNNSVVQASYDNPCHPLEDGFISGFIPIDSPPAGVDFSVTLDDTEPVYFYDAQDRSCQDGNVGSINAPTQGETYDSFAKKAGKASTSTHPAYAPQGGTLTVNSTIIPSLHGAVLHLALLTPTLLTGPESEDDTIPASVLRQAGGGPPPPPYGKDLSLATETSLQLLQAADNVLLETLADGLGRVTDGEWRGVFPDTVTGMLRTAAVQSHVHRAMTADALRHFDKGVPLPCAYDLPLATVDDFVETTLALLLLEIGLYGDTIGHAEEKWVAPALAGVLGVKARTAGLLNLMRNHTAAPTSGEAALPPGLAYSYLSRYVAFCPEEDEASTALGDKFSPLPGLRVSGRETTPDGARVTKVALGLEGEGRYVAWIGASEDVTFVEAEAEVAEVPAGLYGHAWAVATREKGVERGKLGGVAVAGPEVVWVGQP